MKFQFSFEGKYELIFANGQPYQNNIGALMTSVIDMDWEVFKSQVNDWRQKEIPYVCWDKQVDAILKAVKCHPVLRAYLLSAVYDRTLIEKLQTLSETKTILHSILETLVDEDRSDYVIRLYEALNRLINTKSQVCIDSAEHVKRMRISEQKQIKTQLPEGMRVSFVTEEITALVFRELRHLCTNEFIIRKCAHCRGFFWTRTTNKVYCTRIVPGRHATCSQYGPRRKRQVDKRPAYNLYWTYRARAFHLSADEGNRQAFQTWIAATQPYKGRARRGEISLEEMHTLLKNIEQQVFPAAGSLG